MAKKLTSSKAREILHDKSVHGHPLTDKQRRFFGAIAGGAKPYAENGGWLDKYEQGGLVLKKKTKDNYGTTPNANEGHSTAGPGWVGEGTTNVGFDYNGAWGGTMQMGGSMPGAVGFMYARTQNPAPSNGKYTKKTQASAQNGQEMKFYQDGLDFKPKSISQNGNWLEKYATEPMRQDATRNVVPRKMTASEKKEAQETSKAYQEAAKAREKAVIAERQKNRQTKGDLNTPGSWHVEDKARLFPSSVGGAGEIFDEYINPATYVGVLADALGESIARKDPKAIATSLALAAGTGAIGVDPLGSTIKGIKSAKNLAKQAYKINPLAEKLVNPNMAYRIADEASYQDFLRSGVVRPKSLTPEFQNKTFANFKEAMADRPTSFPSFAKGKPAWDYLPQEGKGYIYATEQPVVRRGDINPVTGKQVGGRHWAYRPIDEKTGSVITELPSEKVKVYSSEPHWLKGYQEIPNIHSEEIVRGPINWWEEPGFSKRNPNFNPQAYVNSPVGKTYEAKDVPQELMPYISPNPTKQTWQSQELPGLHLSSTMEGGPISKIIEPKTGLINVDQALTIIGKESGGADKVNLIKQALGKDIPKKMDYNDFRKTVQDQLIPLDKEVVAAPNSDYGIDRLGYTRASADGRDIILNRINNTKADILKLETEGTPWDDAYLKSLKRNLELDVKDYNNLPLENQTIRLSNKNEFGRGSDKHSNPKETLGHIHFLRDPESPDVLTMTQLQSDAFQGTHRIMPKNLEEATTKLNSVKDDVNHVYETFGNSAEEESSKRVIDKANEMLNLEQAHVKNLTQKSLLDKNHQERYLQELVDYAGKRGDINKIRVPTSETAAKVQGYRPVKTSSQIIEEYNKLKGTPELEEQLANTPEADKVRLEKVLKGELKGNIYDLGSETILKKYSQQPKVIKKVFGVEPKTVIDSKGNSWYEFNIPDKFKGGKGEIKAFKTGGIIDSRGQWAHPGEVTIIPGNDITMKGVDYDVLGVSNTGDKKLMKPGKDYKFDGDYVTEYPKKWLDKYK